MPKHKHHTILTASPSPTAHAILTILVIIGVLILVSYQLSHPKESPSPTPPTDATPSALVTPIPTIVPPLPTKREDESYTEGRLEEVPAGAVPKQGSLYVVRQNGAWGIYNTDPEKQVYTDSHEMVHTDVKVGQLTLVSSDPKDIVFYNQVEDYKKITIPNLPISIVASNVRLIDENTLSAELTHPEYSSQDPAKGWIVEIDLKKNTIKVYERKL